MIQGKRGRGANAPLPSGPNRVRIIGGMWRGRRLTFPEVEGLRPSPDRVRETLFNWLQPMIAGARCLDLFAGSGALGFEALSRGASEVVLVDRDRRVIDALRRHASELQAEGAKVVQSSAIDLLRGAPPARPFDLAFLDPPFRLGLVDLCCRQLEAGGWLAPGALVYIEAEGELDPLPIPSGWEVLRSRKAGQVGYHLVQARGEVSGGEERSGQTP